MTHFLNKLDDVSRREFAKLAAKTFLGVSILPVLSPRSLHAEESQKEVVPRRKKPAKNIIYLYMNGGMSHLDTFDVKPGADTMGPTTAIYTT